MPGASHFAKSAICRGQRAKLRISCGTASHWKSSRVSNTFQSRVVKVLCEVSPPKQYVEDMARIVVNQAKEYAKMQAMADEMKAQYYEILETNKKLREQIKSLNSQASDKQLNGAHND